MGSDDTIFLRSFEQEDERFLIELRQNRELFHYTCGNTYYMSSEHSKKLLRENVINNEKQLYLIVCLNNESSPIGYLNLCNIDHINKKVEWGGIIIDPHYTGKGYATSAARLMLKFIFEEWNMNRIYGYWLEDNTASIKVSEKLGFIKEGILREHIFKNSKYHNVYLCSLLKRDFKNI